ncbi:MAG: LPS export ABC transporter periplasmic protein LptC [Spirochaetota bacterium]
MSALQRRMPSSFAAAALLALVGCSLDYDAGRIAQERPEELPETVLFQSSYTVERESNRVLVFSAERLETYPEQEKQLLYGISFQERNAEGEVLSSGTSDEAIYFTDTSDVELSGGILFRSETEGAEVTADYLYWNDEESRLTSRENDRVTVVRDSGSEITGLGFEADTRLKEVSFSADVSGRLVTDDAEEDNAEEDDVDEDNAEEQEDTDSTDS